MNSNKMLLMWQEGSEQSGKWSTGLFFSLYSTGFLSGQYEPENVRINNPAA